MHISLPIYQFAHISLCLVYVRKQCNLIICHSIVQYFFFFFWFGFVFVEDSPVFAGLSDSICASSRRLNTECS